ncbi:MAG: hypothetical protein ACREJM_00925, partial [Candidatus Saccharimonadales bacterium]
MARDCSRFVLVMHDWSHLHFGDHASKEDRIGLGNSSDLGYELQSALLVSDREGEPRRRIHGPPLTLRLVISRIRGPDGEGDLAVWFLLSNVPAEVQAEEIALWYYWRWRIESFFKLLKSAGQQLEHWQQE